jgi:hypothetical protein
MDVSFSNTGPHGLTIEELAKLAGERIWDGTRWSLPGRVNPKVATSRSITAAAWPQIEEQLQSESVWFSSAAMAELDCILQEHLLDQMPVAEAELVDLPTVLSAMQEQNAQF